MIKDNMFYGDKTIDDYREISLGAILREYLLYKGTWNQKGEPINKEVSIKDLVSSGLYVYGLKNNPTNRKAIEYYCMRKARIYLLISQNDTIVIPEKLWNSVDEYNKKMCKKKG